MFGLLVDATTSTIGAGAAIAFLVVITLAVFYIGAMWKVFTKAGRAGWLSLIPIVNTIVLCHIAGKSGWWILLLCIPVIDVIVAVMLILELSKAFGHGMGFALGLLFLGFIFWPILGYGSSQYHLARQALAAAPAW